MRKFRMNWFYMKIFSSHEDLEPLTHGKLLILNGAKNIHKKNSLKRRENKLLVVLLLAIKGWKVQKPTIWCRGLPNVQFLHCKKKEESIH